MRKLSEITTNIIPMLPGPKTFGRRPLRSFAGQLTTMVLFRHDDQAAMISVSPDDDAVGAVWIQKGMVTIDPKDRGRFLVVTMSQTMVQQHNLGRFFLLDFENYLPEERAMLRDAVESAARSRKRINGQRAEPINRREGLWA